MSYVKCLLPLPAYGRNSTNAIGLAITPSAHQNPQNKQANKKKISSKNKVKYVTWQNILKLIKVLDVV